MRRIGIALALAALAMGPSIAADVPAGASGHPRGSHTARLSRTPERATLVATYQSTSGGNEDF